MTYYSYSRIRHEGGVVEFGEKVDQKTIGASDEDWQHYIDTNTIGEEPVPDDMNTGESLSNYYLRKANEAVAAVQAGELPSKKQAAEIAKAQEKADESATSKS